MRKVIVWLVALALALCPVIAFAESPSTRAFPVSARRAVRLDNENAKAICLRVDGVAAPMPCYVVPDGTAQLRFEIAATDDPAAMVYEDDSGASVPVSELLDTERGAYVCDRAVESAQAGEAPHYGFGRLADAALGGDDPEAIEFFLIRDEAEIKGVIDHLRASGDADVWEYADAGQAEDAAPAQAYVLHVADPSGAPVPGLFANFCTDASCTMAKSDETGTITFDGAPDAYHVQLLKVPDGYRFDADFEMYIGPAYGEWKLIIWKD